jgi:hypothetical protein
MESLGWKGLNAAFAIAIMDLISQVHLPTLVNP